jgi:hypothetical protein
MTDPIWARPSIILWTQQLLDSFHRWMGVELLERQRSPAEQAHALFHAPFVVVSHGTGAEPILNYGNRAALELWEMTWEQLTSTPSHQTAEPANREERTRMLALADERGYFTGYRGIRISGTGRRFLVTEATVWNVVDQQSRRIGQAATFSHWAPLP